MSHTPFLSSGCHTLPFSGILDFELIKIALQQRQISTWNFKYQARYPRTDQTSYYCSRIFDTNVCHANADYWP